MTYRRKDRFTTNMTWGYGYLNVYCNRHLIFIIKKFIVFKFRSNMSLCSLDFEWNPSLNNLYKHVLHLIDSLSSFIRWMAQCRGLRSLEWALYLVGRGDNVSHFCCLFCLSVIVRLVVYRLDHRSVDRLRLIQYQIVSYWGRNLKEHWLHSCFVSFLNESRRLSYPKFPKLEQYN